jgi:DNA-binding response OmpR family regulator/HPt (histidine-containing phosphotransfer) domain-containing protein
MKKILIIEDDPIVVHIYRTRLEKEGYTVETCDDGQAGFYRIHEFHPDGVLLDLMLPKMNGVDILKKIRAQSQFANVPVIVFTNAYVPNMIQEAFSAGASQVFNKATLTPRQILDSLHLLLNSSGQAGGAIIPMPSAPSGRSTGGTAFARKASQTSGTSPARFTEPSFHSPPPPAEGSPPPPRAFASPDEVEARQGATDRTRGASVNRSQMNSDDAAFHAELFEAFTAAKSETLATLRKLLQDFTKAPDDASREPHLLELYRKVHSLTGSAGIAGFACISQLTAALEVLLKELHEKPKNINASTLRTVAHSIDFIGDLFKAETPQAGEPSQANILVVDDEILSRRAVTYALEKASLKSINVEDSAVALKLATENTYDVIFLDVQMPGMDGFELCTKIRALPTNKTTPIIFVTSLTDFKSRAKYSLSGGTDLIAKPFMFIELTVKALTHVLRGRVGLRKLAA